MHDAWWDQLPDIYSRPVMSDTIGRPTQKPEMSDAVRKGHRDVNMDFRGPAMARIPQVTTTLPSRKGMLPVDHELSETIQLPSGRWANISGRTGERLEDWDYGTMEEAVEAAIARSDAYRPGGMLDRIDGRIIPRRDTPRPKTPMNGGVRG